MALQNNPFYLLKVSCNAGRREIVSAADEMSFVLDSETSSKAQNELINLNGSLMQMKIPLRVLGHVSIVRSQSLPMAYQLFLSLMPLCITSLCLTRTSPMRWDIQSWILTNSFLLWTQRE